jgi:hypothetical protein
LIVKRYENIGGCMSHLLCPLCGSSKPISRYDPKIYDLDLTVVQYSGKGRGRGFEKINEESVLGDDYFSPLTADRVLDLTKMFLDEKTLTKEKVFNKLNITNDEYNINLISSIDFSNVKQKVEHVQNIPSLNFSSADIELRKIKNQIKKENYIIKYLEQISNKCESKLILENGQLMIEIYKIDVYTRMFLTTEFSSLDVANKKMILDRVKTEDNEIKDFLYYLEIMPTKITLADFLLDLDLSQTFPVF